MTGCRTRPWRYDLTPEKSGTRVRVTYDWSVTPAPVREEFGGFPAFYVEFLQQSLDSLAAAVTRSVRASPR